MEMRCTLIQKSHVLSIFLFTNINQTKVTYKYNYKVPVYKHR
jgi:hypothetical protein